VLFAVLPLGTTTYAEAGIEVKDGGDPGAPVDPKLGRKAFTTTWVSAIVFLVGYLAFRFHLIPLHG
jgi:predicted secreted protein